MTAQSHQLYANPCLGFLSHEPDDSQVFTEYWQSDFIFMPTAESLLSGHSPYGVASLGLAASSPGPFLLEPDMDWEPLLEPGFASTEKPAEYPGLNFDATLADTDGFHCPSPFSLTLSSPTFTRAESDGWSWEISPIQQPTPSSLPSLSPPLSPVLSQGDMVPHIVTLIDHTDLCTNSRPTTFPVVPSPLTGAPSLCAKVHARAPRLSARHRELAAHNVRVDSQALRDKLEKGGHDDKIEALNGLLGQIDEFVAFRENYGHNRATRANIPPPERLGSSLFSPFVGKLYTPGKPPTTKKTLLYVCGFCKHELSNRTQMIQHLMAKHFRYFPHECGECDATFCRAADLRKHARDKHSGVSVPCRCGKTFSNKRNYQRHQKPKKGVDCMGQLTRA